MKFFVEGRYFDCPVEAFTFASIQADRMKRSVEIRLEDKQGPYHGTAYPSNYVRSHLVRENSPLQLDAASAA